MLTNPRTGQAVQVWYKDRFASKWHRRIGIVKIAGRGKPRNHLIVIDKEEIVIPCGNLRKLDNKTALLAENWVATNYKTNGFLIDYGDYGGYYEKLWCSIKYCHGCGYLNALLDPDLTCINYVCTGLFTFSDIFYERMKVDYPLSHNEKLIQCWWNLNGFSGKKPLVVPCGNVCNVK